MALTTPVVTHNHEYVACCTAIYATRPSIRLTNTTETTPGGFLSKIERRLSKGIFVSSSPSAAPGPNRQYFQHSPHPAQRGRCFAFLLYLNLQVVDESPMDIFASAHGTASVSIPDMPCSAPTAPSQAAHFDAGAGYYATNSTWTGRARVGVHLGLGLHLGSETGSAHTGSAYAYANGYSQRRRTNVHTPIGTVGRVLLSQRCSRSAHQHSSSPEDVYPSDYSCGSAPPSASASVSAFAFPSRTIEDGSINTSTVSYIGSGASIFTGLRTSADAGEGGEAKGSFGSSLSGFGFVPTLLPTTTNQGRFYRHIYTRPPTHPPTRAVAAAAAGVGAACWV